MASAARRASAASSGGSRGKDASGEEALRDGMVSLLEEALSEVARHWGLPEDTPVREAAEALEEAARGGAAPGQMSYPKAVSLLRQRLGQQTGPFPDDIAGLVLLRARPGPRAVSCSLAQELWTLAEPGPREVTRRAFLRTLLCHPGFAADRAAALAAAKKIEMGCYNAAVRISKESEDPPRRQWDSPGFVEIYSARCGTIEGLLHPETEASLLYGARLADRLFTGELALESVGAMSSRDLCPRATEAERAEISERASQRVVDKPSNLFCCPHCRVRACTYKTVQRRALDEASDYDCLCLACGLPFKGRH